MRVPRLGRHKASSQGCSRFNGKVVYFGVWPADQTKPPAKVQEAYAARLEKWLTQKRREAGEPVPSLNNPTVAELWLAYKSHIEGYYVKNGRKTSEAQTIIDACRIVARLFGEKDADEFGPLSLKAVRDEMVRKDWARTHINKQVSRVRGMFRWATENQIVPVSVLQALKAVAPLAKGRSPARETEPIKPVSWSIVEKTLPKLAAPLPDMVRVHYLLGCRAADIVIMRPQDIEAWTYTPYTHKTEHRGEQLTYCIGPKAREILAPLIACTEPDGWIFSTHGKKGSRHRLGRYSTASYRRAIARACQRAKVERWFPLQLRHSRLTDIRRLAGIEGAQAVASHKNIDVTEIYAEKSQALARKIMEQHG